MRHRAGEIVSPTPPAISLIDVHKHFGSVAAVDGVTLDIAPGEFFTLLGPSGSGKTTVLRMIAGFERSTGGVILLDGVDVTHIPPFDRNVNTVFQDYALFPHMSVLKNIEYGLLVKKVRAAERTRRAMEALEAVRLADYGSRKPSQLSGGQRQRVALARALVNRPRVLLLDEPLGALDLKLREEMQVELKAIQHEVGITFVFVTHDQDEALTMSDRIAVFDKGKIVQVGTPREVYEHPTTRFVAGFVGTSNLIEGPAAHTMLGTTGTFCVRPERLRIVAPTTQAIDGELLIEARVQHVQYVGSEQRVRVMTTTGSQLVALAPTSTTLPEVGQPVRLIAHRPDFVQLVD
jgi:putative spermidine/putrescine transport system ATP-binding protein